MKTAPGIYLQKSGLQKHQWNSLILVLFLQGLEFGKIKLQYFAGLHI